MRRWSAIAGCARHLRDRPDAAARRRSPAPSTTAPPRDARVDARERGRRRAAGAGLRAHPAHRRRHRLVFGRPALGVARLARSAASAGVGMRRGRRDLRGLRRRRRHRRLDGRGLRARSASAPLGRLKLPGRGWLEFEVTPLDGGRRSRIRQIATFDPRGVLGRLYWYAVYPFHAVVFGGLLRELARRATAAEPYAEASRSAATRDLARIRASRR